MTKAACNCFKSGTLTLVPAQWAEA